MRIHQIMKRSPVTCATDDTMATAARLLLSRRLDVVAVVDEAGRLVGQVTDQDVARAANDDHRPLDAIPVANAMSHNLVACYVGESIDTVARLMRERHCRQIPVVDAAGRPVGLLDLADLHRPGPGPTPQLPPAPRWFRGLAFSGMLAEASVIEASSA